MQYPAKKFTLQFNKMWHFYILICILKYVPYAHILYEFVEYWKPITVWKESSKVRATFAVLIGGSEKKWF